ncbi:MAG TPA: hypothetical protein VG733_20220 [Chthoniobacteraceae bacterium]|nr:hypothetical protein [Chthoniobacteraceae bacterium]
MKKKKPVAPVAETREEDVDPDEVQTASERVGANVSPAEIPPKMENLTEWDTPPDSSGSAAPKVLPEDETSGAEELVEEGVEEADRDQRMASSDPDFDG